MGKTVLTATDEELREMYEVQGMTLKQIAEKCSCSSPAVCLRMKKAGIKARDRSYYAKPKEKKIRKDAWAESEIGYLLENYENTPNHILAENLPGRTKTAIYKKARKLGLHPSESKQFQDRSYWERNESNSNWKGGMKKTQRGYIMVLMPDHHRADKSGYVMEHIIVAERKYGRNITENDAVHHINEIKDDNRPENLLLMSHGEHTALHNSIRSVKCKASGRRYRSRKCIDMNEIQRNIDNGMTVADACHAYGIGTTAYYSRRRERS